MSDLEGLKNWSKKQGYILTGGGTLESRMLLSRDYEESDLPHYHLLNNTSRDTFSHWLKDSHRDFKIVGAWSRPLFSGGWAESTDADTLAFNLQTPSIFIDLRFPVERPTYLAHVGSLQECSALDLRKLSRQHCFAGYSLPEPDGDERVHIFTRHHVIDWNFHPAFPRTRPNRWRAELKRDDGSSFKELSTAVDAFGVPVYFERWARRSQDSNGEKYFAARKNLKSENDRDAILVVVGDHFAVAVDRGPITYTIGEGCGSGPAWVDYLAEENLDKNLLRMQQYLDLCGIYGRIGVHTEPCWTIEKSTHPWLEKASFIRPGCVTFSCPGVALGASGHPTMLMHDAVNTHLIDSEWTVLENSFTQTELSSLFLCDAVKGCPADDQWTDQGPRAGARSDGHSTAREQFDMLFRIVSEPTVFGRFNAAEQNEILAKLKTYALGGP